MSTTIVNADEGQSVACPLPELRIQRRFVRLGYIYDEEWIEGDPLQNPASLITALKKTTSPLDIFSFCRPLPETNVIHPYAVEWENAAIARTHCYTEWWDSLPQESRKNVRRSERRGVSVQSIRFTEEIAEGLRIIYNETPFRQGRRFPHYGKSLPEVISANSSFLERSECIGAFYNNQLIGFLKFVRVNKVARIMQIIAMEAHADKRPTNALLAKAMAIACEKEFSHLVYGRYIYGNKASSPVTEFKRRNGFEQMNYPRYFVPLTSWGHVALSLRVHREVSTFLPEQVTNMFLRVRAALYQRSRKRCEVVAKPPIPSQEISIGR